MKKFKKLLSLALCFVLSLSVMVGVIGCGGGSSNVTEIQFVVNGGGLGRAFADNAAERFEQLFAEESYAEGKKGVDVVVSTEFPVKIDTALTSAYDVYVFGADSIDSMAKRGYLLNINDAVTEKQETRNGVKISIEDKMTADSRLATKSDGQYYAAPYFSYSPGLSYDIDCFDRFGFYLADNQGDGIAFSSELLGEDYYFVSDNKGEDSSVVITNKSKGPDATPNTYDDGLPSSMEEMVALCEYMKSKGVYPFLVSGMYPNMANFMLQALTAAMQGYERAKTMYTLDGQIEVVTGFSTTEELYIGTGIMKPITEPKTMTEANGYYTSWAVEKYYAEAFMDLCFKKDWWHGDSKTDTVSQRAVMSRMIFNGYENNTKNQQVGMLVEASFWYNEAEIGNYPQDFDILYNSDMQDVERKISFMPLPTKYYTADESDNKQTFLEQDVAVLGISARIKDDAEKVAACKDFIQFLLSDAELNEFTKEVGIRCNLDYKVSDEVKNSFDYYYYKSLEEIMADSRIVNFFADNNTFKTRPALFKNGYFDTRWMVGTSELFTYLKNANDGIQSAFNGQKISKQNWSSYYSGTVTD